MWCNCTQVPNVNMGCLNIPYSPLPQNNISIRIKLRDEYIDFASPEIEGVFIIVKKFNDTNSSEFTRLSIPNGYLTVDSNNSQFIRISFDDKMNDYIGNTLYYQMFMKLDGMIYPLAYGEFIKEKTFLK